MDRTIVRTLGSLAGIAVTLIVPGTAPAAIEGARAAVVGGTLLVDEERPGGAYNDLQISYHGPPPTGSINVLDVQEGVVAGDGCTQVSSDQVRCQDSLALTGIQVELASRSDFLEVDGTGSDAVPTGLPVTVYGGQGDDTIRSGRGSDRLFGDSGADFIAAGRGDDLLGDSRDLGRDSYLGGPGRDRIRARDGSRDRRIDCGGGRGERARRDRGLDPRAVSCR